MNDLVVQQQVHEITPIMYEGQRVLTFKQIDAVHRRPEGTARKRFNDNKERLIEGRDFFEIRWSEFRTISNGAASEANRRDVIAVTESGYLLLVKSFTDDLAWEVQRKLVDTYFRAKNLQHETVTLPTPQHTFDVKIENHLIRVVTYQDDSIWVAVEDLRNLYGTSLSVMSVVNALVQQNPDLKRDDLIRNIEAPVPTTFTPFQIAVKYAQDWLDRMAHLRQSKSLTALTEALRLLGALPSAVAQYIKNEGHLLLSGPAEPTPESPVEFTRTPPGFVNHQMALWKYGYQSGLHQSSFKAMIDTLPHYVLRSHAHTYRLYRESDIQRALSQYEGVNPLLLLPNL